MGLLPCCAGGTGMAGIENGCGGLISSTMEWAGAVQATPTAMMKARCGVADHAQRHLLGGKR